MFRMKQSDNQEADYMAKTMSKAFGKKQKNKWDRGDKLPFDLPKPKEVSIKGGESEVPTNYTKKEETSTSHEERGLYQDGLAYDDDEYVVNQLRQARIDEFKAKNTVIQKFKAKNHGEVSTIVQSEFLPIVTETEYVICHFYHEQFETCEIMDKHLKKLAPKYLPVKFIRINAENAPFFVEKLCVSVLPTVIMFKNGVVLDRITGFEGLTDGEDFPTEKLERRFAQGKVLVSLNKENELVHGVAHTDETINEEQRIAAIRASILATDDFDFDTTESEE